MMSEQLAAVLGNLLIGFLFLWQANPIAMWLCRIAQRLRGSRGADSLARLIDALCEAKRYGVGRQGV